jgi:predicted flap endonuclease-1-like 5' DNA nuclease
MVIRKIKELLGLGAEAEDGRADSDVVVQEESPDTETEAAVKGTGDEESPGTDDVDEPVATETDADASTESLVDEEEAQEHPESRAEPAEAAGPGAVEESTDVEDSVDTDAPDAEKTVEDEIAAESEAEEEGTPVDEIKGIGPAYSERLGEVGIHDAVALADANPAELAERITVSEKTVGKWVDRAKEHAD